MGDRYLPGAVVRVQVKNFLTYDFAEFFPGPYLNMIIVRPPPRFDILKPEGPFAKHSWSL